MDDPKKDPEKIEQADKWLANYLISAIKTEREKKENLLVITYDPRENKTFLQKIELKK